MKVLIPVKRVIDFNVKVRVASSGRSELTSAGIVVSYGQGVGSQADFALLEKLADKLNAAMDSGCAPNDWQVGQNGKIRIPNWPMPSLVSNHGNYIVSTANVCRWMAGVAEGLGVEIFPGTACSELVYKGYTLVGSDPEIHEPGPFYELGMEFRGKYVFMSECVCGSLHDAFLAQITETMTALRLGDPLDGAAQGGPVVSEGKLANNLDYVRLATDEGCTVVSGQRLIRSRTFKSPALHLGVANQMRSSREKVFDRCADVIRVSGFDEALAVPNDTPFGFSSGVRTGSLCHATAFRRRSKAGMALVNLPTAGVDYHEPFGGRGVSSLGQREQERMAMDFYTLVKTAYVFAG